jgi:hypothetical protein
MNHQKLRTNQSCLPCHLAVALIAIGLTTLVPGCRRGLPPELTVETKKEDNTPATKDGTPLAEKKPVAENSAVEPEKRKRGKNRHTSAGKNAEPPQARMDSEMDRPTEPAIPTRDAETAANAKQVVTTDALARAELLEAPPLVPGEVLDLKEFAKRIRELASDEFAFKDAQAKIYRATFDCASLHIMEGRQAAGILIEA